MTKRKLTTSEFLVRLVGIITNRCWKKGEGDNQNREKVGGFFCWVCFVGGVGGGGGGGFWGGFLGFVVCPHGFKSGKGRDGGKKGWGGEKKKRKIQDLEKKRF